MATSCLSLRAHIVVLKNANLKIDMKVARVACHWQTRSQSLHTHTITVHQHMSSWFTSQYRNDMEVKMWYIGCPSLV